MTSILDKAVAREADGDEAFRMKVILTRMAVVKVMDLCCDLPTSKAAMFIAA